MNELMENRLRIGSKIREIRIAQGLSTYKLGDLSGVPRQNISDIENGRRAARIDTINSICLALGCSLEIIDEK